MGHSQSKSAMRLINCVVVGDGAVGKTCLCVSFTSNSFPDKYVPTVFDDYMVNVENDGKMYDLNLCDTSGYDDCDQIRSLLYAQANVFLVCFSVVNPESFENVRKKWEPEIRQHCKKTPILLVGTQIDLRQNPDQLKILAKDGLTPITFEEGKKLAEKLRAVKYVECSALTQVGLNNIFDEAISVAPKPRLLKCKWKCGIF